MSESPRREVSGAWIGFWGTLTAAIITGAASIYAVRASREPINSIPPDMKGEQAANTPYDNKPPNPKAGEKPLLSPSTDNPKNVKNFESPIFKAGDPYPLGSALQPFRLGRTADELISLVPSGHFDSSGLFELLLPAGPFTRCVVRVEQSKATAIFLKVRTGEYDRVLLHAKTTFGEGTSHNSKGSRSPVHGWSFGQEKSYLDDDEYWILPSSSKY